MLVVLVGATNGCRRAASFILSDRRDGMRPTKEVDMVTTRTPNGSRSPVRIDPAGALPGFTASVPLSPRLP